MIKAFVVFCILPIAADQTCSMKLAYRSFTDSIRYAYRDLSLDQCLEHCLSSDQTDCKWISYSFHTQICTLGGQKATKHKERIEYYHRICDEHSKTSSKAFVAENNDACFIRIHGKVLIGTIDELIKDVSESQCEKTCRDSKANSDVICKAAVYYSSARECIISSQDRNDLPDLYIDDKGAIYIENLCNTHNKSSMPAVTTSAGISNNLHTIETATSHSTLPLLKERTGEDNDGDYPFVGIEEPDYLDAHDTAILDSESINSSAISTTHYTNRSATTLFSSSKIRLITALPLSTETPLTSAPAIRNEDCLHEKRRKLKNYGEVEYSGYTADTTNYDRHFPSSSPKFDRKTNDGYGSEDHHSETENNQVYAFNRVLRDPVNSACFKRIYPLKINLEYVVKSYSLDQCTDMCRICKRCLNNKPCISVGFSLYTTHCAMGSSVAIENDMKNIDDEALVYYQRSSPFC